MNENTPEQSRENTDGPEFGVRFQGSTYVTPWPAGEHHAWWVAGTNEGAEVVRMADVPQGWSDRRLLDELWGLMMNEDGDPIEVPTEPNDVGDPECVRKSDGLGFDLAPICGPDLWDELHRRLMP